MVVSGHTIKLFSSVVLRPLYNGQCANKNFMILNK